MARAPGACDTLALVQARPVEEESERQEEARAEPVSARASVRPPPPPAPVDEFDIFVEEAPLATEDELRWSEPPTPAPQATTEGTRSATTAPPPPNYAPESASRPDT